MDIKKMYQEIILEHNKSPRNFGKIDPYTKKQLGHNPLCGDKIVLFVYVENEQLLDISFDGEGCAISRSSASLLTEAIKKKTLTQALSILSSFEKMLLAPPLLEEEAQILGKLIVFENVKQYPARVKCALLACRTLQAILKEDNKNTTVTSER